MTAPARPAPTCPLCGDPLTRPEPQRAAQAPPWLCVRDARGWEEVELLPNSRKALRPQFRDFGDGPLGLAIADQARAAARERTAAVGS